MGVKTIDKVVSDLKTYKELNENVVVGLNNLIKVVVRQNNNVRV